MYNREHQSKQIPSMAYDEPMSSYSLGVRSEPEPKPPYKNDNPQKQSETWQKLLFLLCQ